MAVAKACELCPDLVKSRSCIVGGRGPIPASIMLIGLAPGQEEDEQGKNFVGRTGQLLRLLCDATQIPLTDVYLDNAIRCHPAGNRRPKVKEIEACRPHLMRSIKEAQPDVIVTLGDVALQSVMGAKGLTLGSVLGHTLRQPETNIPVIPTYHPAFMLRGKWEFSELVMSHLDKARRLAAGELNADNLGDYAVIDTVEKLHLLRDYLLQLDRFGFDTETTGLSWQTDELLGICFSGEPGEGFVVPLLVPPDLKPFWPDDDWPKVVPLLKEIFASDVTKIAQNCFTPETRILTADLRWLAIDDVAVGDDLIGFDEQPKGQGRGRCYKPSRVVARQDREAEVYEITFVDGTSVTVTEEHPFLAGGRHQKHRWVTPIRWQGGRPPRLSRLFRPWSVPEGAGDTWLAGFLDADGAMSDQPQVLLGQLPGALAEHFKQEVAARGRTYHSRTVKRPDRAPFEHINVRGPLRDVAEFLGTVRPIKLLSRFQRFLSQNRWELRPEYVSIRSIRPLGRRRVVNLQTSSHTFIAEGWAVHNCIFDLRFLERRHILMGQGNFKVGGRLEDTLLLHHSLQESLPHNLTALTALHTDLHYYEAEIRAQTSNKRKMLDVDPNTLWEYGAADADAVLRVRAALQPRAEEEGTDWALEHIMYPLIRFCWNMEQRGLLIDLPYFDKLCEYYKKEIDEKERKLFDTYGEGQPFKYRGSRPRQALLRRLDIPFSGLKTKGAQGCEDCELDDCEKHDQTGKDALLEIKAQTSHPIIDDLIDLDALHKRRSTYLDGGKGGFKRYIGSDGRIRAEYRPGGTETSRLTAKEPAVQTMPGGVEVPELETKDALRRMVIAPEGKGIMTADWSQAEVWALAYIAPDEHLLEVLQSDQDIHTWAARIVWPDVDPDLKDFEWKREHPDLRKKGKVFVFGNNYGLTIEGAMERLHSEARETQLWMSRYLAAVPGLQRYRDRIQWQILHDRYVENVWGQRRHFSAAPILKAMGRRARYDLEALFREGANYPIQSSISGLHSIASVRTDHSEPLRKRGVGAVLSLHDSLTMEFDWPDDDYAQRTAWMIKNMWEKLAVECILPNGERLGWHIPVEVEWGPSWGESWFRLAPDGSIMDLREEQADD